MCLELEGAGAASDLGPQDPAPPWRNPVPAAGEVRAADALRGTRAAARLRRLPESARAAPPCAPFLRPPRRRERFPGGGPSRIGLRRGRRGAAGAPLRGPRGCRPPARPPPRTPAGSPPPLRPTRFRAASLGEAAAGPPPGAGSSLARPGGPGHPRRPPPARPGAARAPRRPSPAPRQRRNQFSVGNVEEGPE